MQSQRLEDTGGWLVDLYIPAMDHQSCHVHLLPPPYCKSTISRLQGCFANASQDQLRNFRTRIHIGFVLIVVTWLAVLLSILFSCYPMEKNWQIYPDPGSKLLPLLCP
jgi:hypothetical protein